MRNETFQSYQNFGQVILIFNSAPFPFDLSNSLPVFGTIARSHQHAAALSTLIITCPSDHHFNSSVTLHISSCRLMLSHSIVHLRHCTLTSFFYSSNTFMFPFNSRTAPLLPSIVPPHLTHCSRWAALHVSTPCKVGRVCAVMCKKAWQWFYVRLCNSGQLFFFFNASKSKPWLSSQAKGYIVQYNVCVSVSEKANSQHTNITQQSREWSEEWYLSEEEETEEERCDNKRVWEGGEQRGSNKKITDTWSPIKGGKEGGSDDGGAETKWKWGGT